MKYVSEAKLKYFKEKLLNVFATKNHTHSISNVSNLETELNNKIGTDGGVVNELNSLKFKKNARISIPLTSDSIANTPFARAGRHDRLAFLNCATIIEQKVSLDGINWIEDTLQIKSLFMQKEKNNVYILGKDEKARTFTLHHIQLAHSMIDVYEIGVNWVEAQATFEIHIESSKDGKTNWNPLHKSTISVGSQTFALMASLPYSDPYLRFTFTKTSDAGEVSINSLKGMTTRRGDQGMGIEFEKPYDWDYNRNIYPHEDNKSVLGTIYRRWYEVYASRFVGNLIGNADSATNASKVNNHTVDIDVPANAKFTDTIYTHPSSHPATMIIQDGTHRFVSDTEKANWNSKANGTHSHTSTQITDMSELTNAEIDKLL